MQPIDQQELNCRITTFLKKKNEEFPELKLRPQEPKGYMAPTASEVFSELLAGLKWEFGRNA